jgi:hypothetical protein
MNHKKVVLIIIGIITLFICLALSIASILATQVIFKKNIENIGFDFKKKVPAIPTGDIAAGSHLFIHRYPVPGNGNVTGFEYLNDYENGYPEKQEKIILLLLRPDIGGWKVLYRFETIDDNPVKTDGITRIIFELPVSVQKGDILATYQPSDSPSGGIPLNGDDACTEGKSSGLFGFEEAQVQINALIPDQGFSGCRDYFINLLYHPR